MDSQHFTWLLLLGTRNHHLVEVRKKGVVKDSVEKVTVKACGGRAAKVCGKFVYPGTLMSPTARETEEVTRRCQKAMGVFGTLRTVWQRRSINDRVKGRLFEGFVSSVLLLVQRRGVAAEDGGATAAEPDIYGADAPAGAPRGQTLGTGGHQP
jgi:hypothetical protein